MFRRRNVAFHVDDTVSSRASADSVAALTRAIEEAGEEALLLDIETNLARRASRTAMALFQLPNDMVCRSDNKITCTSNADCMACSVDPLVKCVDDTICVGSSRDTCRSNGACVHRGLELVREIVDGAIVDFRAAGQAVNPKADKFLSQADDHLGKGLHKRAYEAYRKSYRAAAEVVK
jgi:hypothetical protein